MRGLRDVELERMRSNRKRQGWIPDPLCPRWLSFWLTWLSALPTPPRWKMHAPLPPSPHSHSWPHLQKTTVENLVGGNSPHILLPPYLQPTLVITGHSPYSHLSHLRISLRAIAGVLSHPPLPPGYYGNTDFCADTSQIDGHNAITFVLMTGIQPVMKKSSRPDSPHRDSTVTCCTHTNFTCTHLITGQNRRIQWAFPYPVQERARRCHAPALLRSWNQRGIPVSARPTEKATLVRDTSGSISCVMHVIHACSKACVQQAGSQRLLKSRKRKGKKKGRSGSRINHLPWERAAVWGVANRRLTDRSFSAYAPPPRRALQNAVRGEATATDVAGFRPHPFSTLPVLYTSPPWPLPPPNGCTWLSFASSCTCSASFQNVSFSCSGSCLTWYIHPRMSGNEGIGENYTYQ